MPVEREIQGVPLGAHFRLARGVLWAGLAALTLLISVPSLFAAPKNKARRNAEFMLLRGIEFYENNEMESATESFMEVMRMGATADETALAREYLDRIMLRMGGHRSADLPKKSSAAAAPAGMYLPSIRQPVTGKSEQAPEPQASVSAAVDPDTLHEYVERKFRAGRLALLERLKKREGISVLMKDADKFLALGVQDNLIYSQAANFQKDSGDLLNELVETAYFHPRYLIHIYPAWTDGRSSVEDLQRASVLAGYITGRGVTPERIKVEMERGQSVVRSHESRFRDLETMFTLRNSRMIFVFEELSGPLEARYFFTQYLPRQNQVKDYPVISLGISREKIDTRKDEGAVIEFLANSTPVDLAQWRLVLKTQEGGVVMTREGRGATLESIYFDGKTGDGPGFSVLSAGSYTFEAEAINIAGGKVRVSKDFEIEGGGIEEIKKEEEKKAEAPVAKKEPPKKKAIKKASTARKKSAAKSVKAKPKAAPVSAAPAEEQAGASQHAKVPEGVPTGELLTYRVTFGENKAAVSERDMEVLKQVSNEAKAYPTRKFSMIGLASPEEKDAGGLAQQRVRSVAKILSSEYGVQSSRLMLDSGVGSSGQREVEISVEE